MFMDSTPIQLRITSKKHLAEVQELVQAAVERKVEDGPLIPRRGIVEGNLGRALIPTRVSPSLQEQLRLSTVSKEFCEEKLASATEIVKTYFSGVSDQGILSMQIPTIVGSNGVLCFVIDTLKDRGVWNLALGRLEDAASDASKALLLIQHIEQDCGGIDGSPQFKFLLKSQAFFLMLRGEAMMQHGDLDAALVDFRAANAIFSLLGSTLKNGSVPVVLRIVTLMAILKAGSPRPHYTKAEMRAINKELRFKQFSVERWVCENCGACPSETVKLKECGRCYAVWYCSKSCQSSCWTTHKSSCTRPKELGFIFCDDSTRTLLDADIASKGYFIMSDPNGEPGVIVKDPVTGTLFESLSDQEVLSSAAAMAIETVQGHYRQIRQGKS